MFSKDDVLTVARAMIESHVEWQDSCRSPDLMCVHCFEEADRQQDIKHNPTCPVLVAQDLLTGAD